MRSLAMVSRTEYISRPTGILEAALVSVANGREAAAVAAMLVPINSRRVGRLRLVLVMADILTRRRSHSKMGI